MIARGNVAGAGGATGESIRVLIAEEDDDVRDRMRAHLIAQAGIDVIGAVGDGERALRLAGQLQPDVAILSASTPRVDGLSLAENLSTTVPYCQPILTSTRHDMELVRRAMLVGVREFLVKPFNTDDLTKAVRRVYEQESRRRSAYRAAGELIGPAGGAGARQRIGSVITFWGPKGGVGRTFLAANTALAMTQSQNGRVLLMDGSLEFGNVDVILDIDLKKGITDLLVDREEDLDPDLIGRVVAHYQPNLDVLLTPPTDVHGLVTPMHLQRILAVVRRLYDYVLVDTRPSLDDTALAFLDLSDIIVAVSTPELTALRNLRVFLDASVHLGYGMDKVRLVINRYDMRTAIPVAEIEKACRRTVSLTIGNDHDVVAASINQGKPVIISQPQRQVSKEIAKLAELLLTPAEEEPKEAPKPRSLGVGRLFTRSGGR